MTWVLRKLPNCQRIIYDRKHRWNRHKQCSRKAVEGGRECPHHTIQRRESERKLKEVAHG